MSHHIKTKFDWIVYSELGIRSEGMIYFLVSLSRFFRFYSVLNLPRHNSKHKLSLIWTSFLGFFYLFLFFLGSFVVFFFPNDKKSRMVLKKGRTFPCRQYMCRFALPLSDLPIFSKCASDRVFISFNKYICYL